MRSLRKGCLLILALALSTAYGQQGVDVYVETHQFQIPGSGPRLDIDLAIAGGSTKRMPDANGDHRSRIQVVIIIEKDSMIVAHAKTEVKGPATPDGAPVDFLHHEHFDLAPGSYDMSLQVTDLNMEPAVSTEQLLPLQVRAVSEGVQFSDVLLAQYIAPETEAGKGKYGYVVLPLVSTYYPSDINELRFYVELYNTDKVFGQDSLYLLTYQLEQFETRKVHGAYKKVQRTKARPVEVVMAQFDIRDLPSGNFILAIEVVDRTGKVVGRQEQFIQRNNPLSYDIADVSDVNVSNTFAERITDRDTLAEFINSMRPIGDDLERKIIDDRVKDRDLELMQRFFYSFWYNRNGLAPESAWKEYHAEVIRVNKAYGSRIRKGYETDRGYIHLRYGAPNSILDRPSDPDAYPYQIWHYYKAGRYANRRFVFYLPDLVSNDYELLHSDMRGEVQNPRWNQIIHSRNVPMNNVDVTPVNSASGERLQEFFDQPR